MKMFGRVPLLLKKLEGKCFKLHSHLLQNISLMSWQLNFHKVEEKVQKNLICYVTNVWIFLGVFHWNRSGEQFLGFLISQIFYQFIFENGPNFANMVKGQFCRYQKKPKRDVGNWTFYIFQFFCILSFLHLIFYILIFYILIFCILIF